MHAGDAPGKRVGPTLASQTLRFDHAIEATRRIREKQPGIQIIMLTMVERDDSLLAALAAGKVTPELTAVLDDPVVKWAHRGGTSGCWLLWR